MCPLPRCSRHAFAPRPRFPNRAMEMLIAAYSPAPLLRNASTFTWSAHDA